MGGGKGGYAGKGGKGGKGVPLPPYHSDIPDGQTVKLNRNDKDLDLRVLDSLTCESIDSFMWSGCRATHAAQSGKVAFAIRVLAGKLCRVGWSTSGASLNLGQDDQSFGYGGTAKKSNSNQFTDYGDTYSEGDVITALIDYDAKVISFCKNGRFLGEAFRLPGWLSSVPMFPHVLTKNARVRVFYGEGDRSEYPELPAGFTWLSDTLVKASPWSEEGVKVEGQPAVARLEAPSRRIEPSTDVPFVESVYPGEKIGPNQKRLIMLVGLPGSGKTHWAKWYVKSNPHCKFNLLSTNLILERKMPNTKWGYDERWERLIKEASQTLEQQLEMASKETGNIIWDQTNVYPNARRRKLQRFQGFHKTAIVFIPPEDLHKKWIQNQREETGQNVPADVVAQMKKNFELPSTSFLFDQVIFAFHNSADDVQEAMARYKREAADVLSGKRPRDEDYDRHTKQPRQDYQKSYQEREWTAGNPYAPSLPYRDHHGDAPRGHPTPVPTHSVAYTRDRAPQFDRGSDGHVYQYAQSGGYKGRGRGKGW
eukprot:Sspe_Gene.21862::Locus_8232_Transcript_1_1_Confidence_1.000_Length_1702::g.21862::m.21862/K15047/HNRNPUL1, E1BAP5; heterogeneous nuclear ribonucleoprotein U-like protein 1